jgi:flagellar basal-body rod modification protein FlgD
MTITSVNSSAPAVSGAKASKTLGQADFIRLMTTQMKMQDPLEPVDNKEMIAQMAQFSSLAGIDQINQTLQAISAQLSVVMAAQQSPTPPTSTP